MSKLLLIDDEEDVRYSIQRIFDSPDIELATAASGEEGLKVIPKFKPDLVLMDVRMTGMTGLETLRRIRQSDPKLLVILMTAYGTTQTAIEAMKLGAYDYLLKPFDIPKLKEIVANAFKAARDMRQVVSYEPLLETEDYELGIVGRSEPMQQVFKLIGQVARAMPPRSSPAKAAPARNWSPGPFIITATAPNSRFWRSTAPPSPNNCSRANCSATKKAPSPAPPTSASANSSNAITARSSWMKSAT